jgi:hypothetical protein
MDIEKFRFYDILGDVASTGQFAGFVKGGIATAVDLFVELERVLAFPCYFGHNWNAVSDCLRDFHWRQESEIILVHHDVPGLAQDELALYLEILVYSMSDWEKDGTRVLSVFFPSSAKAALLEV